MSQGRNTSDPVKDETPFIEWNGYRYDLYTYSFKEGYGIDSKVDAVKRCTTTGTGLVNNKALLNTTAKMRLCASNDGSTGIDTIPSGVTLIIKEIQLRHSSSSVYYVRVESVDGKYKGWVSLGSSHYDLYIRGVRIINDIPKESDLYEKWVTPITWRADDVCEYRLPGGGTVTYDGTTRGITYNF